MLVEVLDRIDVDRERTLVIVDEAHNIEGTEGLRAIVERSERCLLMSGTMPEHLLEDLDAEVVYRYPIADAIRDGAIVDYRIYVPSIIRKGQDGPMEANVPVPEEVRAASEELALAPMCLYLASGMMQTGARRTIVYLRSHKECEAFLQMMRIVAEEYHGMEFWGGRVTMYEQGDERARIFREFQEDDGRRKLRVLATVRVVDEGIDLPKADSVFITCISSATREIRMVQRICRAVRKDPANPNKMASVFLWCDSWAQIIGSLELLREEDVHFMQKLRVLHGDYDQICESKDDLKVELGNLQDYVAVQCISTEEWKDTKIQLLIEHHWDARPSQKKSQKYLVNGRELELKLGYFVNEVRNNWRPGYHASVKLSEAQKARMMTIPWMPEALDKLQDKWENDKDKYVPTVDEKIQLLIDHHWDKQPVSTKEEPDTLYTVNGHEVRLNLANFRYNVLTNWREGCVAATKLDEAQKQRFLSIPWAKADVDRLRIKWQTDENKYVPTRDERIELLIEHCMDARPPQKEFKQYHIGEHVVSLDLNSFIVGLYPAWQEGDQVKSRRVVLTEEQKNRVMTIPWVRTDVESLKAKWAAEAGVYKPTKDDRITLLIEHHMAKCPSQLKAERYKIGQHEVELCLGEFVYKVSNNWRAAKKPDIKLDEAQKAQLMTIPWFKARIEKLQRKWAAEANKE